VFFLLKSSTFP